MNSNKSFDFVGNHNFETNLPKTKIVQIDYPLESFHRSNQDTTLVHKPAVFEGQWVESGDLLADCSTSVGGDLSLGQNLLIGYMPWEGYNFEDAILISERLVYDDLYTSVHIEKYEVEIRETELGIEQLTREIPEIEEKEVEHLNSHGIAKLGSWVEQGDILVGKVTPIKKKEESPYQKLLYTILDKKFIPVRDSSLRAPKGTKAKVIDIQYNGFSGSMSSKGKNQFKNANEKDKSKLSLDLKNNKNVKPSLHNIKKGSTFITKSKLEFLKSESQKSKPFFNNQGLQSDNSLNINKRHLNIYAQHELMNQINNIELLQQFQNTKSPFRKKQIKKSLLKLYSFVGLRKKEKLSASVTKSNQVNLEILSSKKDFKNLQSLNLMNSKNSDKSFKETQSPAEFLYRKNFMKLALSLKSSKKNLISIPKFNSFQELSTFSSNCQKEYKSKSISIQKNRIFFLKNKIQTPIPSVESTNSITIYLADKRRIQVGDKMSGRHGNKGIVSQILPREDMPYLPDGTPLDMVLNPLGVPSRMNVGQIYECLLGFAGKYLGEKFRILPFDEIYGPEASRSFVYSKLYEARLKTRLNWLYDPNNPGKIRLYDGRTGDCFDQSVTVGQSYILRLVHMVDDKIHARSTGPYSLVTQQPLRGRSKQGGQRLGEMEVWALEGYGAAFTLLEMLTIKSDDMTGRMTLWSNLLLDKDLSIGTPESFKVLICELQALCLDIGLFRPNPSKNYRLEKIENLINLR